MAGADSLLRAAWQANKKLPLVGLVLILANVGLFIALNGYVRPQVETLERSYIDRQAELRQRHLEGRRLQEPQTDLRAVQDDLEVFWQAIPQRGDLSALIGELFALAEDAGLTIKRIQYDPEPVAERPLLRYGLSFSVAGQYAQVKRFIYSLEQSERLLTIESVVLSSDSEPEQGQVSLSLRLSTLFLLEAL